MSGTVLVAASPGTVRIAELSRRFPLAAVRRGTAQANAEFVRGLEAQTRAAESRVGGDPRLKLAHECLAQGRYARLFRLLQESWNRFR